MGQWCFVPLRPVSLHLSEDRTQLPSQSTGPSGQDEGWTLRWPAGCPYTWRVTSQLRQRVRGLLLQPLPSRASPVLAETVLAVHEAPLTAPREGLSAPVLGANRAVGKGKTHEAKRGPAGVPTLCPESARARTTPPAWLTPSSLLVAHVELWESAGHGAGRSTPPRGWARGDGPPQTEALFPSRQHTPGKHAEPGVWGPPETAACTPKERRRGSVSPMEPQGSRPLETERGDGTGGTARCGLRQGERRRAARLRALSATHSPR